MTQKEEFIKVMLGAAFNIDCEKIAASMEATGWYWSSVDGVPNAQEVRQNLSELVNWLVVNYDAMHLVDGQTVAQPYTGGWHYTISYWHPWEYRITIIHGHSGEADNINNSPYEQLAEEYCDKQNVTITMTEQDAALYLRRHELYRILREAHTLVRSACKRETKLRLEQLYSLLCEATAVFEEGE